MPRIDREGQIARASRVLVFGLLLLALLGGTGVAAIDDEPAKGSSCPGVTHERGSDFAADTAVDRSFHGRTTALTAIGCL